MEKEMRLKDKHNAVYDTVRVADLRVGRRGKHYELLKGILANLEELPAGSALVVPLDSVGKVSLANLRSAMSRAAKTRQLSLETYSDEKNFYLWRKASNGNKSSTGRKLRK
jgi:HJR/Mrr/RecB family endonuclease